MHGLIYAVGTVVNELVFTFVEKDRFGSRRDSGRHVIDLLLHVRRLPGKLWTVEHVRLVNTSKGQKRVRELLLKYVIQIGVHLRIIKAQVHYCLILHES